MGENKQQLDISKGSPEFQMLMALMTEIKGNLQRVVDRHEKQIAEHDERLRTVEGAVGVTENEAEGFKRFTARCDVCFPIVEQIRSVGVDKVVTVTKTISDVGVDKVVGVTKGVTYFGNKGAVFAITVLSALIVTFLTQGIPFLVKVVMAAKGGG